MFIKLVALVKGLSFSNVDAIELSGIYIRNNDEHITSTLFNNDFIQAIGLNGMSKVKQSSALAYITVEDDITIISENDLDGQAKASASLGKNLKVFSHQIITFDAFLWMVKDNSCNTFDYMAFAIAGKDIGFINMDYKKIVSNCIGEFEHITYTSEEVKQAYKYRTLFFSKCPKYIEEDEVYNEKQFREKTKVVAEDLIREYTPLERAFSYIRAARNSKDLAPKFAMYMSMFESLMTFENTELTHRVGERVAFYLTDDASERKQIYKDIKEAYDIRSRYVHGSSHEPAKRRLFYRTSLLLKIDSYARQLFKKALSEESEIFLDEKKHQKFVQDIIFIF